jgi:hypothetical protein
VPSGAVPLSWASWGPMTTRHDLPHQRSAPEGAPSRRGAGMLRGRDRDDAPSEGRPPVRLPPRLLLLGALLAFAHLVSLGASPIADGPRDPLPAASVPDRWTPPLPVTDARFATFPLRGPQGQPGLWVLPSSKVPLEFVLEQEVIDRFGEQVIHDAVESWNDTPGSRFGATVSRVVEVGVDERRRDGANRIFLDRRSCGGRYLARAHLWPGELVVRDGRAARYITEVDLGLCDRLRPEQVAGVIRHELGHIAGLDHLCEEGEDCHRPGMAEDNTCRVMSPRAHPCQEPTQGDRDGLVHLHPRLPRVAGGDGRTTSASASLATHPTRRASLQAVITPYDAAFDLRVAGATLAGHLGAPHLLVDDACTTGPAGRALDRVVALAGTVHAVGPVAEGCLATLRGAWALRVEHHPDAAAVRAQSVEHLAVTDRPPSQLVVAPAAASGADELLGAVVAPAAVAARAPLVLLDDPGDPAPVLELLEPADRVTEIILVGDLDAIPLSTQLALGNAGAHVRRLPAADASQAAVQLVGLRHLWGAGPFAATLAAAAQPDHVLGAIGVAVAEGGFVLPIDDDLHPEHETLLRERVDRGALVGGIAAIGVDRQIALSRLVDGDL